MLYSTFSFCTNKCSGILHFLKPGALTYVRRSLCLFHDSLKSFWLLSFLFLHISSGRKVVSVNVMPYFGNLTSAYRENTSSRFTNSRSKADLDIELLLLPWRPPEKLYLHFEVANMATGEKHFHTIRWVPGRRPRFSILAEERHKYVLWIKSMVMLRDGESRRLKAKPGKIFLVFYFR